VRIKNIQSTHQQDAQTDDVDPMHKAHRQPVAIEQWGKSLVGLHDKAPGYSGLMHSHYCQYLTDIDLMQTINPIRVMAS
jgi:hypothetical protein